MTKTVHRSARSRTARRGHAGQMTGPKPCDPDPAGAVTPATRPNWAICTIAVREVDEGLMRTESAIDFLLEQWERPRDDRRQGRQSVGEYSVSRIDIRADDLVAVGTALAGGPPHRSQR